MGRAVTNLKGISRDGPKTIYADIINYAYIIISCLYYQFMLILSIHLQQGKHGRKGKKSAGGRKVTKQKGFYDDM